MKFVQSKRSGVWFVQFLTRAGRKQMTTGETDLARAKLVAKGANIAAIEMARRINLMANAASMYALIGRAVSSEQALNEWFINLQAARSAGTCFRYEVIVRAFLKKCGWPSCVGAILPVHIDKWINSTSDLHAITRNVHRCALISFFKFCENEGWCKNPVLNVPVKYNLLTHEQKEKKQRRPFTPEEFTKLIDVAKEEQMPYWYGALMIARYTGLRWRDVEELETASVHKDHIVVWTRKREKRVELPMPPELPPVFDLLAKHPHNQPSFAMRPGKIFQRFPAETIGRGASDDFHRLLNKAQLPDDLTPHCLRHTYAVELSKSGIGLKEIARRMGHYGEDTTLHYLRSLLLP